MTHKGLISDLQWSPGRIESGFRFIAKEFHFGHTIIDLLGRDKDGNLCLVEVKVKDSELKQGKIQVRKYQIQIAEFLGYLGLDMTIRAMVITPSKRVELEPKRTLLLYITKTPMDIPTSREVYGLKEPLELKEEV